VGATGIEEEEDKEDECEERYELNKFLYFHSGGLSSLDLLRITIGLAGGYRKLG
jgi:hypothetical protein